MPNTMSSSHLLDCHQPSVNISHHATIALVLTRMSGRPDSATNSNETGILDGLPCTTSEYQYTLLANDKTGRSQYVVFSEVDGNAFETLSYKDDWIPYIIKDYFRDQNLLVMKMGLSEHEQLLDTLAAIINVKVTSMGLFNQLRRPGSSQVETWGKAKRPDRSFQPRNLPESRPGKWPLLAIETGYSESLAKLQADAKFWITESAGNVNIILVAKIDQSNRQIDFEK